MFYLACSSLHSYCCSLKVCCCDAIEGREVLCWVSCSATTASTIIGCVEHRNDSMPCWVNHLHMEILSPACHLSLITLCRVKLMKYTVHMIQLYDYKLNSANKLQCSACRANTAPCPLPAPLPEFPFSEPFFKKKPFQGVQKVFPRGRKGRHDKKFDRIGKNPFPHGWGIRGPKYFQHGDANVHQNELNEWSLHVLPHPECTNAHKSPQPHSNQ